MKNIYRSTITHNIAAFICGLCLLFVMLTVSLQAVCYWIPDWWRNEYAKYDTPSNVRGEMSLDDAVHVTEDMLEYCIGRLDTLDDTEATIDGVTAPFFTDREKAHLADCRELFLKGIRARVIACLLLAAFAVFIYVHNGKQKTSVLLAKGYLRSLGFVAVMSAVIADLWILYPDRDNLINIMQEDVFSDAAMWIAGIWLAASALIAAACVIVIRKDRYSVNSAVE